MKIKSVIIKTDGASKGNPGRAAIGATIKDKQGRLITSISQAIGRTTNNQAEYRAIIAALEEAIRLSVEQVELFSDSELVVRQINGQYRVKKASLGLLYQQVKQLQSQLESFTITHIPREQNAEADNLANKALNLVANLPPAETYRLIIKFNETSDDTRDIALLYKIITALKDFPGKDEVKLSITNKDKVISLRLADISADYCPELRQRLVQIVGKRRLKLEPADSKES